MIKQIKLSFRYFLFNKVGMKKTVSIGVRLPLSLAEALENVSDLAGLAPSTLARMAIEEYLRNVAKTGTIVLSLEKPDFTIDSTLFVQEPDGKTHIVSLTTKGDADEIPPGATLPKKAPKKRAR